MILTVERFSMVVDGTTVVGSATAETIARYPDAQVVVCTASSADPERRRRLVTRLGLIQTFTRRKGGS